ncbi:proline--tRNA ligase [Plasmodium falciparum NF54]|uniref:Proline--tRNA ligase, putative n=2 Tax=Plasmodium falciparum TaxID=5833 RepID=Q8I2Q5_PLAF7|nr:proline--tRNA ligase, putative [Plasmodium falciparum 3D7]KAF4330686.1 proline--tRNA ligase [Plasmodium falciparum NF54]PKC44933.1 proline--tRNA ligase [Plasmodium falciparum NF54]CAD51934.1 proline--tRNA ligase, putative [Plasmodium falciparum 3D7]|eukprot:XP_001352123.1 proline--tRNA ligase, putative [Plasmodium falciparum 3D7]
MLIKIIILIGLFHHVILSLKLVNLKKKRSNVFFVNNKILKRNVPKKKYRILSNKNQSYIGSNYIFNRIFNDNIKSNGDKTSELLQRANYIRDVNGIYNILPLGFRVINKIIDFLNKHLEKLNSHAMSLSILQAKKLWNISDRSKLYSDEFLYVYKQKQSKNDKSSEESLKKKIEDDGYILSPTCEESSLSLINQIYNENITIKCLPLLIHQYNYKFRNEKRFEKSLFKSKEFLMKDGYSFHSNEKCLNETYEKYKECYKNIFEELKLSFNIIKKRKKDKMNALESHEFQVLSRDGKYKEAAHIFKLGDYYSNKLDIKYLDKKNEKKNILMGSYGIGIYRLLYFLIENFYDEEGIKLPQQVAPFSVYLIQTNQKSKYSATKISKILNMYKDSMEKKGNISQQKNEQDDQGDDECGNSTFVSNIHNDDKVNKDDTLNNNNDTLNSNNTLNHDNGVNINNTLTYSPLTSNDIEYILTLWLFNTFKNKNVDIYYDDTDLHLSRKLKHCDLIGAPNRIIINLSNLDKKVKVPTNFYNYIDNSDNILLNKLYLTFQNITIEYKHRFSQEKKIMTIRELFKYFKFI